MTSPIHNRVLFLLWLCLFLLSGGISPLISSSILGTYRPGEFISQCPIYSAFHSVRGFLKARILKWFVHSLLQWTTFCQNYPPWPVYLGWPHTAWLSFIELDKAVVHVVRMVSFSVCLPSDALSQRLPSYLGFFYLVHGVSLHGCSSKAQLLLLTLYVGYLLMPAAPDLGWESKVKQVYMSGL